MKYANSKQKSHSPSVHNQKIKKQNGHMPKTQKKQRQKKQTVKKTKKWFEKSNGVLQIFNFVSNK